MSGRPKERRSYPRVDVAFSLRIKVEVEAAGSKAALGTTVNVSRGGILATVDRRLSIRSHCRIRFHGAEAEKWISQTEVYGVVLRVKPRRHDFLVALMFDEPLDELKVTKTAWKKKRLPHRGPRDG